MLAPIVQRRPFPTAAVGILGGLLYAALLCLPGDSTESRAAPEPADTTNANTEKGNSLPSAVSASGGPQAPSTVPDVSPVEGPRELAAPSSSSGPPAESTSEARDKADEDAVPKEPPPLEFLRGHLTDELGRSLSNWRVHLTHAGKEFLTETGDSGWFEIGRVERGEYSLLVWNPRDLRSARTLPLATTASALDSGRATCRLPEVRKVLEGKMRTASGRPLIGVSVTPVLPVPRAGGGRELLRGESTLSQDEGHLVLRNIPRFPPTGSEDPKVLFWVRGGGVFPALLEWQEGALIAEEGAELLIEWTEGGESLRQATHLLVSDAEGRPRKVVQKGGHSWSATWDLPLADLRGEPVRVLVPLDVVEIELVRRTEAGPDLRVTGRSGLRLSDLHENRVRLP